MKKLGQFSAAHLVRGRAAFQRITNWGDICRQKLLRTENFRETRGTWKKCSGTISVLFLNECIFIPWFPTGFPYMEYRYIFLFYKYHILRLVNKKHFFGTTQMGVFLHLCSVIRDPY